MTMFGLEAMYLFIGKVHIREGAIIGAGSIVTKDVPSLAIYAGEIIKYRDKEKYNQLKTLKKFIKHEVSQNHCGNRLQSQG